MTLDFTITFHAPFVVSSGTARHGLDVSVDWRDPLPGRTLRGLLRHHATQLLAPGSDKEPALVAAVFGSAGPRNPSPWVFHPARLRWHHWDDPTGGLWNRVKLDAGGRSADRFLASGEQVWATSGTFAVEWAGAGQPPPDQVLVLRAAARALTSLGLHRRRGRGWVSIVDADTWTTGDSQKLIELRGAA